MKLLDTGQATGPRESLPRTSPPATEGPTYNRAQRREVFLLNNKVCDRVRGQLRQARGDDGHYSLLLHLCADVQTGLGGEVWATAMELHGVSGIDHQPPKIAFL